MDGLADVWPQGCMKGCVHTRSNIEKEGHAACDKTGFVMSVMKPGHVAAWHAEHLYPQRPSCAHAGPKVFLVESMPLLLGVLPLGCLHGFDGILPDGLHNRLDLLGIDANR